MDAADARCLDASPVAVAEDVVVGCVDPTAACRWPRPVMVRWAPQQIMAISPSRWFMSIYDFDLPAPRSISRRSGR